MRTGFATLLLAVAATAPAAATAQERAAAADDPDRSVPAHTPEWTNPSGSDPGVRTEIDRALDQAYAAFARAYREADPDAVAALYAEDAYYLQPGSPIRRGRETIREGFARYLGRFREAGAPGPSIEFEIVDRDARGDLAYDIGYYRLRSREDGPVHRGKFVVVWKKTDEGTWRIHADGFSDAPPPPQKGER